MCRLLTSLGEIQSGELAVISTREVVVGLGCVMGCHKAPEMLLLPVDGSICPPRLAFRGATNAFKVSRLSIPRNPDVSAVLRHRADAQVPATVVQGITIDMIDDQAGLGLSYYTRDTNTLGLTDACVDVWLPSLRVGPNPTVTGKQTQILRIKNSDFSSA